MSTTRKVTHTHFKDLQSAAATATAEVAKNKKGAPGICGKALGHDNYNPSQVQGINKEEGKDKRWADSDIHVDLFAAWGRTHGAYDLCRQLSHL